MSYLIPGNQRHLTLDDRIYIEKSLDNNVSFKDIAKFLCKDPTSISKEIKKHRYVKERNTVGSQNFNRCIHRKTCSLTNVCKRPIPCKKQCSNCNACNYRCAKFEKQVCIRIEHAPFVCNGCPDKIHCRHSKYLYSATTANREYKTLLSTSREGINLSEEDLKCLDETVSPLLRNGHSPYHILNIHKELNLSAKTLYNYVGKNILSVNNMDLPRKVRYKVRKSHKSQIIDKGIFEGRTFKEFQSFIIEYPESDIVEMDTVVGCEGSHKVLLTLYFRNCKCMLIYLLPDKTPKSVSTVFNDLESRLTPMGFMNAFPVILTDRGGEFSKPEMLEYGPDSTIRTHIYYCDPMCSWQKPGIEKNHEYIRYVLPKGSSFDNLTQRDINLLMNHINNTAMASLNGSTPYELAALLLGKSVTSVLNLYRVKPENIILRPELIKK